MNGIMRICGHLAPASAVFATVLLFGTGVHAEQRVLRLGYDIYIGGFKGFSFDAEFSRKGDGYTVAAAGRSQGMLSWVWDWRGAIAARGRLIPGDGEEARVKPGTYDLRSRFRKKIKQMELGFYGEHAYSIARDPPDTLHRAGKRDLPATLRAGTLDPFSTSFALVTHVEREGRCGGVAYPIFDGDRRYDLTFTDVRTERIETRGYTVFAGEALRCTVGMKRIQGFSRKNVTIRYWDEDEREPPHIWLAKVVPDMPPMPVKLLVDTNLGYLIAYLVHADYNGTPVYPSPIRPALQQARNR